MTDGKTSRRKFMRGTQTYRVSFTIDRSEMDSLKELFEKDNSETATAIKDAMRKAKQFAGECD